MKLGFDIDGVLADFNTNFIQRVIDVTGEDKFPTRPFDIPEWHYPQRYGYTAEQVEAVWKDIKADNTFWFYLPPYKWTESVLTKLHRWHKAGEHDIYFATSRPGVEAKAQTEGWLSLHGFTGATVLVSSAKDLCCKALNLDLYIDDYRVNTDAVHFNTDTRVFLFDQPWNRDGADFYTRVSSIDEMLMRVPR